MYKIKVNGVIPNTIKSYYNYFTEFDNAAKFAYAYGNHLDEYFSKTCGIPFELNMEYELGLGEDAVLITIIKA